MMSCRYIAVFAVALAVLLPQERGKLLADSNELKVLCGDTGSLLYDYLFGEASKKLSNLDSLAQQTMAAQGGHRILKQRLKKAYREILGEFPEKTPLNPVITGTIECDGYIIEKVAYESRPKHYVTANLYVPTTGKAPYPCVLILCGHSANGKAYDAYQRLSILFAKNGFVALIVDPICQGERYQLLNEDGKPATRGGTTTHGLLATGALLVGYSTVAFEAWDNIRSLDYLLSRPEVDPEKVGLTGTSGGGNQTHFLMALDERVKLAAPSCGMADVGLTSCACQVIFSVRAVGIRPCDYGTMFAPKPLAVLASRHDYIKISAVRNLYDKIQQAYFRAGANEKSIFIETDEKHGMNVGHRQAAVRWAKRWFLGDNSPVIESRDLTVQEDRDLWVTETGQVGSFWRNAKNITDLNIERASQLAVQRALFRSKSPEEQIDEIKRLLSIRDTNNSAQVNRIGVVTRENCSIDKLVINSSGGIPVPGLLFTPKVKEAELPAVLYVDGRGMTTDYLEGKVIDSLIAKGKLVLSIDVRGFGETTDDPEGENSFGFPRGASKYWNNEFGIQMASFTLGRPLLGQRVEDVIAAIDILSKHNNVYANDIEIIGIERAGPIVLHAAAIDKRIGKVTIKNSLRSWIDVVANPLSHNQFTHVVPFALTRYDLPDLEELIAPPAGQNN